MLAHEVLRRTGASSARPGGATMLFLHGILARRTNLRTFAQRFLDAGVADSIVMADLRGHGESTTLKNQRFAPPHTIDACADDLHALVRTLTREEKIARTPTVVVGHSFGGKCALAYRESSSNGVPHTIVLDATPGVAFPSVHKNPLKNDSVFRLLDTLPTLPQHYQRQSDVTKILLEHGFSLMVAQWMTTNLALKQGVGYGFVFDLNIVKDLFRDYQSRDLWSTLRASSEASASNESRVTFFQAAKNTHAWSPAVLEEFQTLTRANAALGRKDLVRVERVDDVGHWLHAEKPELVFQLMKNAIMGNDAKEQ